MIEMEAEIKNLTLVWSTVIASLCYCRLFSANLPSGKWRLLSLLPIFCIFSLLPLLTASAFFTAVTAFFITWLSNFKLLLFAFDRGPIVSKSLPAFIAMAALPFSFRPSAAASSPPKKIPLSLPTEIPISALLVSLLQAYKHQIQPFLAMITYCCLIFLMIEILVDSSSLLMEALLGLRLERPSDEPYLSNSLREFWGRRWNLTVSSILRQTVYRPVRSAAGAVMGGERAATVGVVAAFVVSGLMHELLFWYVNRVPPSWEMTMFFVVQGVGVAVESGMKWRLRWPAAVGFVVVTSFWLFFPPVMRNGADLRVIEEIGSVVERVKGVCLAAYNSSYGNGSIIT